MEPEPLVSVVMPVLNAEPWLAEGIRSILAQRYREIELIVVDDGSEDGSREVAATFAAEDRRVRLLALARDPHSTTSGRAANRGIALAKGEYVARMDADDIALPHRIEAQLAFLTQSGLDACGGLAESFGAEEQHYWFPQTPEGVDSELVFRVAILHPTLLGKAELFRRLPYSEVASHEDYEWQVRARGEGATLGNLQEVVLRHRVHPGQANRRHRDLFRRDLRQYRFRHIMRLFPRTAAADYQVLAWSAERAPLHGAEELEKVRDWLMRLSEPPEQRLREKMAARWDKACERSEPPADEAFRERVRAEILRL